MLDVSRLRSAIRVFDEEGSIAVTIATLQFLTELVIGVGMLVGYYLHMAEACVDYHEETGTPMGECMQAVRDGFKPERYAFLGVSSNDRSTYVSRTEKQYLGTTHPGPILNVNRNTSHVLHDKFAIYRIFDRISDAFPTLIGTVHDGRYVSWDEGVSQSLLAAVETYGTVAAKPVDNAEGEGFYKLSSEGGFSVNGREADEEEIERLQHRFEHRDYMITEYLHQHPYASAIYPDTTNTIRLHTVIDPETGEASVVRASHRFGTDRSRPVDTFAKGGAIAPIDVASGEVAALVVSDGSMKRRRRDTHPNTGAQINGLTVPMWEEAKAIALEGAQSYPMARIIGWDVVVTEERPMILEASGQPNPVGTQLECGLLAEPTVRRVFELAGEPSTGQ